MEIKNKTHCSLMFCILFLLPGCKDIGLFFPGAVAADWEFIQSVGGIRLGDPYIRDGHYFVPLIANVSGSQSVTTSPTNRSTGLVCATIEGDGIGNIFGTDYWVTIYIQPESEVALTNPSGICPDIALGRVGMGISPPKWDVYFDDRPDRQRGSKNHLIGTVEF